jgi:hypothetical protein
MVASSGDEVTVEMVTHHGGEPACACSALPRRWVPAAGRAAWDAPHHLMPAGLHRPREAADCLRRCCLPRLQVTTTTR